MKISTSISLGNNLFFSYTIVGKRNRVDIVDSKIWYTDRTTIGF